MSAFRSNFDEIDAFLIKDNELLKKYNKIWGKVSKVIKKEFHSDPVYNDK